MKKDKLTAEKSSPRLEDALLLVVIRFMSNPYYYITLSKSKAGVINSAFCNIWAKHPIERELKHEFVENKKKIIVELPIALNSLPFHSNVQR